VPPHPGTITRRFKRLAASAGLPEIDLDDVRHSYATAGRDAKINWKALSQRTGHADVAFTMKQYVQTDHRRVARLRRDHKGRRGEGTGREPQGHRRGGLTAIPCAKSVHK
jgi:integrase